MKLANCRSSLFHFLIIGQSLAAMSRSRHARAPTLKDSKQKLRQTQKRTVRQTKCAHFFNVRCTFALVLYDATVVDSAYVSGLVGLVID